MRVFCPSGEMVDTKDSKSFGSDTVPVRVRPRAQKSWHPPAFLALSALLIHWGPNPPNPLPCYWHPPAFLALWTVTRGLSRPRTPCGPQVTFQLCFAKSRDRAGSLMLTVTRGLSRPRTLLRGRRPLLSPSAPRPTDIASLRPSLPPHYVIHSGDPGLRRSL